MIRISTYLFLLMLLAALLDSCNEAEQVRRANVDSIVPGVSPDQTGWDVEVHFIDSSSIRAILKAKRARTYQLRAETHLDGGLRVDFFSKFTGSRLSYMIADSAIIDEKTKNMIAKGKVFVKADTSNRTMETSVLQWNNSAQKLYSSAYVVISSPNEKLRGWGFESDINLTNYKIYKVSGEQR